MKRLRFLHMQRVQLTGNFENLFLNLRWLWWDCFGATDIIDIFGIKFKPKRLVVLQLNNCNVTEHWTGWSEMKYLKVLELRRCHKLNTTPDFSAMEELDVLVLSRCGNLRKNDSTIGKFSKSLKVLDVSICNELMELPKEVGKMEELKELVLDWTPIRVIPESIGSLTKLETLSAEECTKLTCIPESIGSLVKLRHLRLSSCHLLTELPKSIGKLELLTELDLNYSGVTKLPDSIGDLSNLEKLSMSGSDIECLPTSIGKLHKLQKLDLYNCKQLKEVPESIGKLKFLAELDFIHLQPFSNRLHEEELATEKGKQAKSSRTREVENILFLKKQLTKAVPLFTDLLTKQKP